MRLSDLERMISGIRDMAAEITANERSSFGFPDPVVIRMSPTTALEIADILDAHAKTVGIVEAGK